MGVKGINGINTLYPKQALGNSDTQMHGDSPQWECDISGGNAGCKLVRAGYTRLIEFLEQFDMAKTCNLQLEPCLQATDSGALVHHHFNVEVANAQWRATFSSKPFLMATQVGSLNLEGNCLALNQPKSLCSRLRRGENSRSALIT